MLFLGLGKTAGGIFAPVVVRGLSGGVGFAGELASTLGCHTPSFDLRCSSLVGVLPFSSFSGVSACLFVASAFSAFSWFGGCDFLEGEMLRRRGSFIVCSLSGVFSTELSLSSLGALRNSVNCRFTISSEEIAGGAAADAAGGTVFLNKDVPEKGAWGLDPKGLAGSEVGEGTPSLPLREPSLLGILGGTLKSFGLSAPLDETFGEGDNSSPDEEMFPSPSVISTSSSVGRRMYVAGTKPSVPLIVPSHQSLLNRLNTRIMSPFLKESSFDDRAE